MFVLPKPYGERHEIFSGKLLKKSRFKRRIKTKSQTRRKQG